MGWKRHFDKNNFALEYEDPHRFVRGPYHDRTGEPKIHPVYVTYRVLIVLLFVSGLIWSWSTYFWNGKWFIYMTHLGYLMCVIQSIIALIMVTLAYKRERSAGKGILTSELSSYYGNMPTLYKIYWVLFNMSVAGAFFITIIFWSLLYEPETKENDVLNTLARSSKKDEVLNFWVHGTNSILCFVELICGGPPSRLLHFYQPLLFGVVYALFNILYWVAGGTDPFGAPYIYPIMDWGEKPVEAIIIMAFAAVLLVILHMLIWAIANVRDMCASKMKTSVAPEPRSSSSSGKSNTGFIQEYA